MDRIVAMRTFGRVVESGSFTKAADTLEMSKGAVTRMVQHLESHLGMQLLTRTTRKVSVTREARPTTSARSPCCASLRTSTRAWWPSSTARAVACAWM